jgi:hypothetical protein
MMMTKLKGPRHQVTLSHHPHPCSLTNDAYKSFIQIHQIGEVVTVNNLAIVLIEWKAKLWVNNLSAVSFYFL